MLYTVYSPLMSVIVPIMDDGAGPTEEYSCACVVDAGSKRAAIAGALKHAEMGEWVAQQRSDGKSPFAGLRAIPA